MELISDISVFTNPFDNQLTNNIDLLSDKIQKSNIQNNNLATDFELDKIKEDNLKKYNDIKSNIILLEEVIIELENKSREILDSIKYLENINKEGIQLFTIITRN